MRDQRWLALHPALGVALLVWLGVSLGAVTARANDFAVGGSGADLVALKETRIRMASEEIVMVAHDGQVDVTADYVFENSGTEVVFMQVGFPEILCPGDVDCTARFWDLNTSVDGVPVVHRQGKLERTQPWSKYLGTIWLFNVSFAAKSKTKVRHTYHVTTGGSVDQYISFDYVTRTGATWAGNIGHASFTLNLPPEVHIVSNTMGKPALVEPHDAPPYVQLRVEHKDWEPKTDLHVDFHMHALLQPDLGKDRLRRSGIAPQDECLEIRSPESAAQLQMCKNLLYALSGRPFIKPELRAYFYGGHKGWKLGPLPLWSPDKEPPVWLRGLQELPTNAANPLPTNNQRFLNWLDEIAKERFAPSAPSNSGVGSALSSTAPALSPNPHAAAPGAAMASAAGSSVAATPPSNTTSAATPDAESKKAQAVTADPNKSAFGCALTTAPSVTPPWLAACAVLLLRRRRRNDARVQ